MNDSDSLTLIGLIPPKVFIVALVASTLAASAGGWWLSGELTSWRLARIGITALPPILWLDMVKRRLDGLIAREDP